MCSFVAHTNTYWLKMQLGEWGWLRVVVMNRAHLQTYPHQWLILYHKALQPPSSLSPYSFRLPFVHTSATAFLIKSSSYVLVPLLVWCPSRASTCSVTQLCPTLATPWTVPCQAPLSMWFPRQQYWSGLPFPPSEDLSSRPRDWTRVSCIGRWILYHWTTREALKGKGKGKGNV